MSRDAQLVSGGRRECRAVRRGQRVGDHGHRHARGPLAAALEDRDALVDQALGDHGVLNAARDVVDAARQPAAGGPADRCGGASGVHAVAAVRGGDPCPETGLLPPEGEGKPNRDHLLDGIGGGGRNQSEAGLGVGFHAGSGFELGFDNDGLYARGADQDVGADSRGVRKHARFSNGECISPKRMLVAKDVCEMAVKRVFPSAGYVKALAVAVGLGVPVRD